MVWIRLQPYRKTSVQRRPSQKLSKRYFEAFQVLRRIRSLDYELFLPTSSRIHPVFHVSQLRMYYGIDPSTDQVPILEDLKGGTLIDEGLLDLEHSERG